jgi:signal transduction histidine kinase/CheY-like chemotaxis protein
MRWLRASPEARHLLLFGILTVLSGLVLLSVFRYVMTLHAFEDNDMHRISRYFNDRAQQSHVVFDNLYDTDVSVREMQRTSKIVEDCLRDVWHAHDQAPGHAWIVIDNDVKWPERSTWDSVRDKLHDPVSRTSVQDANNPPTHATLYMSPPPSLDDALVKSLQWEAATPFLLLLPLTPFFYLLYRKWLDPISRILDADRSMGEKKTLALLEPTTFPPGTVRQLVLHRNNILEALHAKEDALSRRTADIEFLYEFSRQAGLSRQAPDIPGLALLYLSKAVDFDAACMLVFADAQRSITLRSRAPMSEMLAADVEGQALNAYYEKCGILLDSTKLETSMIVGDVRAARLEGKITSSAWAPIMQETKQVGVMGMLNLGDHKVSNDNVRFLNVLAQNTSLALTKLHVMRIEETMRFRNVLENLAEGVVLVRQSGEWALATGTARQFHADICGPEAGGDTEHARHCPIGLLGLDVFHSAKAITREISRHDRTFILGGTYVQSSAAGEQGAVISIRDVTEERATQQQLFQASKLASLGELAAGVAHEVNNPLTGILGFTELLLAREDLPAGVQETLTDIQGLARRTGQITMDLLMFARVQREGGFRPVDVRAIIRDTVKLLETSYRNLHLELSVELPHPDEPLYAMGDQVKIHQIVLNLAQNAKDAVVMAQKGSRIVFRAYRKHDDMLYVEVEDDGPGIPDRIRAKIFDPFFTTKPVGKGTGLGLAIVNRIVEEHKGKLVLESEEGKGTRFRICLPAAAAEDLPAPEAAKATVNTPPPVSAAHAPASQTAPPPTVAPAAGNTAAVAAVAALSNNPPAPAATTPAASPAGSPPAAAPAPRGRVVVLDDEETVLKFLTRSLESDGLKVFATSDPDEAMRLIGGHNPDLVFLDFRMPGLSGEDFYKRLVGTDARWKQRVTFLSGDTTGDEIAGFLKSTGAPVLSKPIGIRDLRGFVNKRLTELAELQEQH